ncbi:MAG: hypothetical protein D6701_09705 [Gemmatimonadetes bacterium]|nr:MAG: hypothetical protein D6701_09705 [Gemmatimonadota bacterium]
MHNVLDALASLPPWLTYAVLGAGAAAENVVPPVPADTFVVLGAFLAARGPATLTSVFLVTWSANVASALLVYRAGYRYGAGFFESRLGRLLLRPRQLERIRSFYRRRGTMAIFLTRFLPGVRAVVPVFAGVSHEPARRVWPPLLVASGLWYGALTVAGGTAGRNLDAILAALGRVNEGLLAVAALVAAAAALWWWRTRHGPEEPGRPGATGLGGGADTGHADRD